MDVDLVFEFVKGEKREAFIKEMFNGKDQSLKQLVNL